MTHTLQQLLDAGLPVISTDGQGALTNTVWQIGHPTLAESDLHDSIVMPETHKIHKSKDALKNIPLWSTYTEAQALAWLDENIGTPLDTPIPANPMTVQQIRAVLVSMVDVMKKDLQAKRAMARILVALRDKSFPNLD